MHVEGIDHVHVRVRDRRAATEWFSGVLGLRPAAAFADWTEEAGGPLFLETPEGRPCLALFHGEPVTEGDHTVAFRADADGFLAFLGRLDALALAGVDGGRVTAGDLVDHDKAWSVYFRDPDSNRFELTTYDYAAVAARLGRGAGR